MRVQRLEIFGFKSFLERLVLPLENGVTGIVGPNGCGKSNIVDGIRWILGESKASSLRGATLEDVIFNGTDTLRPLGLAEVTLTLRASEKGFFTDMVDALPKFANDNVSDVCSPETSPVGSPEGSLEQESVPAEQHTHQRPRLTVIEGALSENRDHSPKEESEVVTEQHPEGEEYNIAQHLTRFAWLKSVDEVQITRRLYRSGESEFFINRVACRLKDIKDLLRAVGLGARAYTIVAQGEVGRIISSKPEERRLIVEEAAGVSGFRDKIAAAARRLDETTTNLTRLDDVLKEVTRQVNSLRVQAGRARNREQLKARIQELEELLAKDTLGHLITSKRAIENSQEMQRQEEELAETGLQRILAQEQEYRSVLMGIDIEGDTLRLQIDSASEELNRRTHARAKLHTRASELQVMQQASEKEAVDLVARREVLLTRKAEALAEQRVLTDEIAATELILVREGGDGGAKLAVIASDISKLRNEIKVQDQALREKRDSFIAAESRLHVIEEQLKSYTAAREILDANAASDATLHEFHQILSESHTLIGSLKIPKELVYAVQAVLGDKARFSLSDRFAEAIKAYSRLAVPENAHFGLYKREASEAVESNSDVPFQRLIDRIEIQPDAKGVVTKLLKDVFVCDSVEQALNYFESQALHSPDIVFVTLRGELLSQRSFSNVSPEARLVELQQESEELKSQVREEKAHYEDHLSVKESLQKRLAEAEHQHETVFTDLQLQQTKGRDVANQLGALRGKLQVSERLVTQLQFDVDEIITIERKLQETAGTLSHDIKLVADEIQAHTGSQEQELSQHLEVLKKQYATLDQKRKTGREGLSAIALQVEEARNRCEQARVQGSDNLLKLQTSEIELSHLKERFCDGYGSLAWDTLLGAVESTPSEFFVAPEQQQEYKEEVSKLKTRMHREGEVDTTSIERFEEEKSRLENLETQKKDLEEAVSMLKRTIESLKETSKQRFLATFKAVRENFSQLIPKLFGGGKGSLELMDPSQPLETGVTIEVRPPGKKLKSIELLSGGEKALCAIALIFSMFIERPSPLCVLDEVDAPLDEANLVRFLTLVKEMSKKTQFLVVTHNKQTMSVAENLVGVTMQQPGASKIISVSLQEAFAQVA